MPEGESTLSNGTVSYDAPGGRRGSVFDENSASSAVLPEHFGRQLPAIRVF